MNWKNALCLMAICGSFAFCYGDGLPSFLTVRSKERGDLQNNNVLYAGESFSLTVNPVTSLTEPDLRRDDLFAVRFVNTNIVLPRLADFGTVLFVSADQHEAIMSVTEPEKIDGLAAFLHEYSGVSACGAMLKLMPPVEAIMASTNVVDTTAADELVQRLLVAPVDPKIKQLVSAIDVSNIRQFIDQLSTFKNRYHRSSYGQQSTDAIHQAFSTYKSNQSLSVNKMSHSNTPQPSVIASLRGTTNPDEIVIIGCHIDSVNSSGSGDITERVAPGSDDNASGTASVKEILRVLSTSGVRFKRTIEFHGYAAEEIGLVGSANVASEYKAAGKKVVGMMQIDMCLYVDSGTPKICVVSNDTDSTHSELAKRLIEQYTSLGWTTGFLGAGTSDHRSWTQRGYKAIFPFEQVDAYNHSIHTSQDNMGKANFVLAENMAKLGVAYLVSLAEIDN